MNAAVRRVGGDAALDRPEVRALLGGRYLIWDAFVAGQARVSSQPLVLDAELHRSAVATAEAVVRVLAGRVGALAHDDAGERSRYGLHPDVERLAAASRAAGDDASLMRVDLLLGEDGRWRACEINADCPGGHNEAHGLPRLARRLGFREARDPTVVLPALADRLAALARRDGRETTVGLTFATAYAEDLQVCAFIERALRARGVRTALVPPTAPQASGDGLAWRGHEIGVLYRFFPTEYMEGQANLGAIAAAIASGRLRTLSSFAWMFAQSKVVMARAWARRATLGDDDAALVAAHVPETIDLAEMDAGALLEDPPGWVIKRALGRVGDEVLVGALARGDEWRAAVATATRLREGGERWVAQRFVPQRPIATPWGDRLVTLGAYVLDGRFVGYFARVTSRSHVSHDALVVPVFVAEDA